MKFLPAVFLTLAPLAHGALITDFNGGTEFGSLFRQTYNETNTTTTAADGVVRATSGDGLGGGPGGSAEVFVYDTTPADGTVKSTFSGPLSVSFDIRAAQAGSSLGIYLTNPASESTATQYLALFNFDDTGGDRVRLFPVASINSTLVGAVLEGSNIAGDAGVTAGSGNFVTATLTYTQGANNSAVLQYTVGSLTTGAVSLGDNTWRPEVGIGFRIYDANIAVGGMEIDNFDVTLIPEPSAGVLGMAGFAALVGRRRRK